MPTTSCLRNRNPVTANNITVTEAGALRSEYTFKEHHIGDQCVGHSDFCSNLSADEFECYMTHRRQTVSESSDDSPADEVGDHCSEKYEKKSSSFVGAMRPNDLQRQTSITQMSSVIESNPRCSRSRAYNLFIEVAVRVVLIGSFIQMERTTPFKRIIHPEEVWLYKNPVSREYVPAPVILVAVISAPLVLIIGSFLLSRDRKDFCQASYAFTLAIGINGFLTSLIKISVGRPRPDFYYRCYPDGGVHLNFDNCTGNPMVVNEGRKSFPSGHSSMSFAAFGFMFFYLAGKLHVFNERGRGQAWRLCLAMAPLVVALEVAISRTCDYRHHWQDVCVGSLLGICVAYVTYRQYFPSILVRNCHRSYSRGTRIATNQVNCFVPATETDEMDENQPLIGDEKDNKWI